MSLGGELAFARLAAAMGGPVALASPEGVASPFVDGAAATVRIATRPRCGLILQPLAAFAPPLDATSSRAAEAARRSPLFVDTRWGDVADFGAPTAIRASSDDQVPAGFETVFRADGADDAIVVAASALPRFAASGAMRNVSAIEALQVDELDAARAHLGGGRLLGMVHVAGGARFAFTPETTLDRPDDGTIAAALGFGAARPDENGVFRIRIPRIDAVARFGLTIGGLSPDAADPVVATGAGGHVRATRRATALFIEGAAAHAAETDAVLIDASGHPSAVLSGVWTEARRRRAAWEPWDEAEARLSLEESW